MATPPDEFVAARNALVKQLKRDGDRESAAAIAAMRRPAWTDWALNVVAADDGEIVDRFAEAASEMREAQKAAFAGRGDVDLRGAINQLRDRAGELARRADKVLTGHQRPSALADLTERLGEIAADATASARLRTGTLIDAGPDTDDPFAALADDTPRTRAPAKTTKSSRKSSGRSTAKPVTKSASSATSAKSTKATKATKADAADRQRDIADRRRAERELKEAERVHRLVTRDLGRADGAVRQASGLVDNATEALSQAEANLARAKERHARAEADREAVQRRMDQAEQELDRAKRAVADLNDD